MNQNFRFLNPFSEKKIANKRSNVYKVCEYWVLGTNDLSRISESANTEAANNEVHMYIKWPGFAKKTKLKQLQFFAIILCAKEMTS